MKLRRLHIENFRRIRELDLDLTTDSGEPRQITTLLGDNGSGKTTVLQAIALVLSLATRKGSLDLEWPGFLAERMSSLGRTVIELDVEFDEAERATIRETFRLWSNQERREVLAYSDNAIATVRFEDGKLSISPGSLTGVQFRGRHFLTSLHLPFSRKRELMSELGDVFWFDQFRSIATAQPNGDTRSEDTSGHSTRTVGLDHLREQLVGAWSVHLQPDSSQGDLIGELEPLIHRVFPGMQFRGTSPRGENLDYRASNLLILLEQNGLVFDIGEMSSGEQAVFPLLWQFVQQRIARSIVLIDELELHLHPPQQQALFQALPKLGPDCQFIITTHSPFLEEIIPDEWEVRLPGGHLCL